MEANSKDAGLWLKLRNAEEVGPKTFQRLLERFGSVDRAMGASVSELSKISGVGTRTAERIARTRDAFDADAELGLAGKLGAWLVTLEDSRYPPALKAVCDPPPVLYVKGTLVREDSLAVAIVGSRRCSLYGQEQAGRFANLLASAGFTIVSGLARGIDTAAHRGALTAAGRTIAVQGCGLATVFPSENAKLAADIAASGAIISELPLRTESLASNFPPRNRIIAALSMGVLVVEAAMRSGSLITADAALDYNREVMAVPGKIDSPLSRGSNDLIKKGARLVDCIDDIMDALGHVGQGLREHSADAADLAGRAAEEPLFNVARLSLSAEEEKLLAAIDSEPVHVEQLIEACCLNVGTINAAAISLQLKGVIKQLPGNMFVRRRK